ncbi:MAG: hypothetical protein ACYDC3_13180 [Candidatus Binataceae bacterium]
MRRPFALTAFLSITAMAAAAALGLAGCATLGLGSQEPTAPSTSVEKLEYYQFQVKGYQNSFPHRSILILMPADQRDFSQAGAPDHEPLNGNPAIGISLGQNGQIVQRLYSNPMGAIVQKAIGVSAEEAGMSSKLGTDSVYLPGRPAMTDYVVVSTITRGWVIKRRGPDGEYGPVWATSADFALEVIIYKPPFSVPFWQGTSSSLYNDPPVGSFGLGPEDEAGVYDDPGEVLSVALTRAVAGIFQHDDFRTLVSQDQIHPR